MGTWATFLLLGLYPVPATRQYLLSSPWFPKVSFYNPVFNSTTTIIAHGFECNPTNGTGQIFVQVREVRMRLEFTHRGVLERHCEWRTMELDVLSRLERI